MQADPTHIVDNILRRTRDAMLNNEFASFRDCFALPYRVETFSGSSVVRSDVDLFQMFRKNVEYYRTIGITDIVRHCQSVDYRDAETVIAVYETRLLQYEQLLTRDPYLVYSELGQIDGDWRLTLARYAINDSEAHNRVLLAHGAD